MADSKRLSKHSKALAADWRKVKSALADTAVDVVDATEDVVSESCDDLQTSIKDYTNKKPMRALGIALAIGFILGCKWKS